MGVKSKPTFSYAHIQRFFLHIQMGSTVSRYRLGQRQTVTVMARSSFNLPARPAARVCKTRGPRRRAVGTGENGHGVDRPGHQVVQVFLPSSWVYAPGLRVFESPFFSGSLRRPLAPPAITRLESETIGSKIGKPSPAAFWVKVQARAPRASLFTPATFHLKVAVCDDLNLQGLCDATHRPVKYRVSALSCANTLSICCPFAFPARAWSTQP